MHLQPSNSDSNGWALKHRKIYRIELPEIHGGLEVVIAYGVDTIADSLPEILVDGMLKSLLSGVSDSVWN